MSELESGIDLTKPPNLETDKRVAIDALKEAIKGHKGLDPRERRMLRKIQRKIPKARPVEKHEA